MSRILNMKASWRAHNPSSPPLFLLPFFSCNQCLILNIWWEPLPVCQGWQPCPVISPVNLSRSSVGQEALAGRWWGSKRERKSRVFSPSLTLCFPNSLSTPHFDSYSQIRAVMVNGGICPFLPVISPCHSSHLPVKGKAESDRQKERLWSECQAYCSPF